MILAARTHKKLAAVVLGLAFATGGLTSYVVNRNSEGIDETRAAQVKECEASLEPPDGVRFQVSELIRDDIQESRAVPPSLFPNIPPATFKDLVRQRNDTRRRRIQALLSVDCEAMFR